MENFFNNSKFGVNVLSLFSSQFITKGINFVVFVILIPRILGDSGYGKFSFAFSFSILWLVLTDIGLSTLTIREIARIKDEIYKYFSNIFLLKIVFSSLTFVIILLTIFIMGLTYELKISIIIFSISMIIGSLADFIRSFFRGLRKMEYEAISVSLERIIVLILTILTFIFYKNLIIVISVFLFGNIFRFLINLFLITKFFKLRFYFSLPFSFSLLKQSYPFAITTVLGIIYFRIVVVILTFFKGDSIVGYYSVAQKYIESIMFLPETLMAVFFPYMSKYFIESPEKLKNIYERITKYLLFIIMPIVIGGAIISEKIVVLSGKNFIYSTDALRIMIFALIFIFINFVQGTVLNSINKQILLTLNAGICTIINVSLNLLLIPLLTGYYGAVISTVVTECCLFILGYYFVSKHFHKINIFKIIYKPLIASLFMGIIIYFTKAYFNLLTLIILGAIIYSTISLMMSSLSKEDYRIILKSFSK